MSRQAANEHRDLARSVGERLLEALGPLIEEIVAEKVATRRTLFTWAELEAKGYPTASWRWLRKKHSRELENAGAVIGGRPVMIDPLRFELVIRALASGAPLPGANDAE
jgi:hypothetical protein